MSEEKLNSYRFLSGEEPTDEMLECIMRDALESVMIRRRETEKNIKHEIARQRELLRKKWNLKWNSIKHG